MDDESNIKDVVRWLGEFVKGVNFTRPGIDQNLGRDLAHKAVEGIATRAAAHEGPDGTWPKNEPKYAKRKAKDYRISEDEPNVRTGQMDSALSLFGATTIEPEVVMMRYGIARPPSRTSTGAPLKKADEQITDREKAYFAHTGQSKKGIIRKFYGLTHDDAKAMVAVAQENLNEMIRDANAANGY